MKRKHLCVSFDAPTVFLEKRNVYSTTYEVARLISTKSRQYKLRHHAEVHTPPCMKIEQKNHSVISPETVEILSEILRRKNHPQGDVVVEDCMDIDIEGPHINDENPITFLFFLGVQGKEYLDNIIQKFPVSYHESVVFTSLNIEPSSLSSGYHVNISNNEQCSSLTSNLRVLDPLGGGVYPLDFLFIIDRNNNIVCSVPLIISGNNRHVNHQISYNGGGIPRHLNFSIEIAQLDGFIDEYIHYFRAIS